MAKTAPKKPNISVDSYLSRLFNGRIGRANYLAGHLIISFGVPVTVSIIGFPLASAGFSGLFLIPTIALYLAGAIYGVSFAVRRFHDIGRKGIELLWFLVPFVNIYFLFLIFFKAGDEKVNDYGPAPNRKLNLRNLFGLE